MIEIEESPEDARPWLAHPPTVGAVLVTHDGATWLPKTLASLGALRHGPDAWSFVDVASTDDSADLLRDFARAVGASGDTLLFASSGTGFGDAVRRGVAALPETEWLWLLHDDAAVAPDALAALLDVATTADDIAVVGPKIREWPSLRRLVEVGLTMTGTAGRETGLETGEPDAGQHDWPRDVLAVNSAGMLVRRDVWDELGGFDEALPLYFDDVDFGWRVNASGRRVRVAPGSVIFHAEASRRGIRPRSAGDAPASEERRAALYTQLANVAGPRWIWQYLRLFAGSWLRVLGFTLGKDPAAVRQELAALRAVYGRPGRLRTARRRRATTSTPTGRGRTADLLAAWWLPYRHGVDVVRDTIVSMVRPESLESSGRRASVGTTTPAEAENLDDGPSVLRRHPWLVAVVALVVVSLVAARSLLGWGGPGVLGGALPPSPETAGDWWRLWLGESPAVGLGSAAFPPVFVLLLAVAATPFWFAPDLVVTALFVLAVPLAALTAHRLGRRLTERRGLRMVWAVSYALSLVGLGAVAEGRLGTVVAGIVLPVIVLTGLHLVERPIRQVGVRWGLWIAVATAFAPIVLPMVLLGIVVMLVLQRRVPRPRRLDSALVATVLTVAVLLGPWLVQRVFRGWRIWWEAGLPLPSPVEPLELLLGRAGVVGAPDWLGVGLLVLATLALVPSRTRTVVTGCWLFSLGGLAFAVLGSAIAYATPGGVADVEPWVGVPLLLWMGGLLTAVLVAAPEAVVLLPRAVVAVLALVALMLPVGTAAWWLVTGAGDPLRRGEPQVVPVFMGERPGSTLVLTGGVETGVDARVVTGQGPTLGQEALAPDLDEAEDVAESARSLLARPSASAIRALAAVGVDAIYAPRADPELASRIDAAPLVEPAGSDDPRSRVWTFSVEPDLPEPESPGWYRPVSVLVAVAWLMALVLTIPVHQSRHRQDRR